MTDSPSQVTLEGISGMVVMDPKNDPSSTVEDDEDQKNDDGMIPPYAEMDIKKGESGGASSSSSSDRINSLGNKKYKIEDAEADQTLAAAQLK